MAVYQDLSPYEYWPNQHSGTIVNVGWLGEEAPYPTGAVPTGFRDALLGVMSKSLTNVTRGCHRCPFCGVRMVRSTGPVVLLLGHAECHVPGVDGTTYAAPTLVAHYVDAHGYRPPDAFVEAVFLAAAAMGESG